MDILTAGRDPGTADHYLWCTPETVSWGTLPTPATPPALVVESGHTVTFDTVSQEGLMEDQGRDPIGYFGQFGVPRRQILPDAVALAESGLRRARAPKGPHIVLGPVHVRGAEAGDWLRVDFLALAPRVPYGIISSRHGRGALPESLPREADGSVAPVFSRFCALDGPGRAGFRYGAGRATIGVRPFMGLCGVTPRHDDPLSTIPPGPFGGNMDLREIVAGSSLYLPVQVSGAGFYLGDPHFAQGNGEIALTALEGSLRVTARLSVVRSVSGPYEAMPFAETDEHWILLGLDESLDEAMRQCARLAVDFLAHRTGMTPSEAYLYLSAAGDFSVTQVVDLVKGVHCAIRKRDFAA
ncbi:acetamidase/formamidase family protein [Nocardia sp. NPDC004568]|uniref:acetamidase/formamidase family protein n=1 Tax=Nocardia sp. NPDC004568 TaxID=3154551 RepID=UPI0033AF5261